ETSNFARARCDNDDYPNQTIVEGPTCKASVRGASVPAAADADVSGERSGTEKGKCDCYFDTECELRLKEIDICKDNEGINTKPSTSPGCGLENPLEQTVGFAVVDCGETDDPETVCEAAYAKAYTDDNTNLHVYAGKTCIEAISGANRPREV